jgi:hypothetical protein
MFSIANYHYPLLVFTKNHKNLLNPINKQRYVIRPEEIVRLRWIEGALTFLQWNKTRISTEQSMLTQYKYEQVRADIILYHTDFSAEILVECKSPSVKLSDSTALQAGLYNTKINAKTIVLTNGLHELWFTRQQETWIPNEQIPYPFTSDTQVQLQLDYWIDRGFIGKLIDRERSKPFLAFIYEWFLKAPAETIRYRHFDKHLDVLDISHFYHTTTQNHSQLHVSILSDQFGKTFLIGLKTQDGKITSVLSIDIDALLIGNKNCAIQYSMGTRKQVHLQDELLLILQSGSTQDFNEDSFLSHF